MRRTSVAFAALVMVGAAVFVDGVRPRTACAEEEVECQYPDFYTWTVSVPIRVQNDGNTLELLFTARPTHTLDYNREKGLYWAWFNPNPQFPYDPVLINDGRRFWYADGAFKAQCLCVAGLDRLRAYSPPNNFIGQTWYEDHEVEDPVQEPWCDWGPCDDGGSGSGDPGGGETGFEGTVQTYYVEYSLVCNVTDWYSCVDGSCRYIYTEVHDCWWE